MLKYKILVAYDLISLEKVVNKYLSVGWKPQGSMFIYNNICYQNVIIEYK
jgi:hypothetical protein